MLNYNFVAVHATFGKVQAVVYSPDVLPKRTDPSVKPSEDLRLVYAPSYNGKTAQHNIHFIDRSRIIFHVKKFLFYIKLIVLVINSGCNHGYKYLRTDFVARSFR